jgi:hypothetical protein
MNEPEMTELRITKVGHLSPGKLSHLRALALPGAFRLLLQSGVSNDGPCGL